MRTLKELTDEWLCVSYQRLQDSTQNKYFKAVDEFFREVLAHDPNEHVFRCSNLQSCTIQNFRPSTAAYRIQIWRKLAESLARRNRLDWHIVDMLQPPKREQELPECLTIEECHDVIRRLPKSDDRWRMVTVALLCGLRAGEARYLHWSEVIFDVPDAWQDWAPHGAIYLREKLIDGRRRLKNPRATRILPISEMVRTMLQGIPRSGDLVFFPGKRKSEFKDLVSRYATTHTGRRLCARLMRHTWATALHAAGVDTRRIALYMGHAGETVTIGSYVAQEDMALWQLGLEPDLYRNPLPAAWRSVVAGVLRKPLEAEEAMKETDGDAPASSIAMKAVSA